jgi:hypothetical protein
LIHRARSKCSLSKSRSDTLATAPPALARLDAIVLRLASIARERRAHERLTRAHRDATRAIVAAIVRVDVLGASARDDFTFC